MTYQLTVEQEAQAAAEYDWHMQQQALADKSTLPAGVHETSNGTIVIEEQRQAWGAKDYAGAAAKAGLAALLLI